MGIQDRDYYRDHYRPKRRAFVSQWLTTNRRQFGATILIGAGLVLGWKLWPTYSPPAQFRNSSGLISGRSTPNHSCDPDTSDVAELIQQYPNLGKCAHLAEICTAVAQKYDKTPRIITKLSDIDSPLDPRDPREGMIMQETLRQFYCEHQSNACLNCHRR
jgi:hypothetical protein